MKIPYNFLGVEQLASEYREYFISQQILPGDFPRSLEKTRLPGDSIRDLWIPKQTLGWSHLQQPLSSGHVNSLTIPLKGHVEFADLPGVDGAFFLEKEHFHISMLSLQSKGKPMVNSPLIRSYLLGG